MTQRQKNLILLAINFLWANTDEDIFNELVPEPTDDEMDELLRATLNITCSETYE